MNIVQANKIMVHECQIYQIETYWASENCKSNHTGYFDINKAECREIVCEQFKIHPLWIGDRGIGHGMYLIGYIDEQRTNNITTTKKEAEIACILQIAEQLNEL